MRVSLAGESKPAICNTSCHANTCPLLILVLHHTIVYTVSQATRRGHVARNRHGTLMTEAIQLCHTHAGARERTRACVWTLAYIGCLREDTCTASLWQNDEWKQNSCTRHSEHLWKISATFRGNQIKYISSIDIIGTLICSTDIEGGWFSVCSYRCQAMPRVWDWSFALKSAKLQSNT